MQRIHVVVIGRVQGVGFRAFVRLRAQALGVMGWVCNRRDGSVECEAEGQASAVAEFVAALEQGPIRARVDRVIVRHESDLIGYADFALKA